MIQGDGKKHEIYLKGNLMSLESSTEYPYGNTTHCLEIVEREKDKMKKDELDALRTSFNHINARNQLMPCQKTLENIGKENKSMAVKIKKQPKTITLEELKQAEEFESVIIYIDKGNKEEIESYYGVHFGYSEKIVASDSNYEIEFKDSYLTIYNDYKCYNVPYDFIEKIEVVEK